MKQATVQTTQTAPQTNTVKVKLSKTVTALAIKQVTKSEGTVTTAITVGALDANQDSNEAAGKQPQTIFFS